MKRSDKGQILIIFALVAVGILAAVGLAVDGGMLYVQRRNAQSAADSAAFAGGWVFDVHQTDVDREAQMTAAVLASAASNGYNNNGTTNTVTMVHPYNGEDNHLQVIITSRINTSFIHLIWSGIAENTSSAVVRMIPTNPAGGNNALIGLSKTDCDTVVVNGNMNVSISGGNIVSNSSASDSHCPSMEKKGTSGTFNLVGGNINVVGSFTYTGLATNINPFPITGTPQIDPFFFPPPSCTDGRNWAGGTVPSYGDVTLNAGNNIMNPGVYGNVTVHGQPDIIMNPGLYCVNGNWGMNGGSLNGHNVLIVMGGGTLDLSGNVIIHLGAIYPVGSALYVPPSPPEPYAKFYSTRGGRYDYYGLMVYADPARYTGTSDSDLVRMGGTDGNDYTGTIFAPNTMCDLNGTSGSITYNSQIYCLTVSISGTADVLMNFSPDTNWNIPPMVELAQ